MLNFTIHFTLFNNKFVLTPGRYLVSQRERLVQVAFGLIHIDKWNPWIHLQQDICCIGAVISVARNKVYYYKYFNITIWGKTTILPQIICVPYYL